MALKRKLTKSEKYSIALKKHIKWLRSLGLNVDEDGRVILSTDRGYYLDVVERTYEEPKPQINDGIYSEFIKKL